MESVEVSVIVPRAALGVLYRCVSLLWDAQKFSNYSPEVEPCSEPRVPQEHPSSLKVGEPVVNVPKRRKTRRKRESLSSLKCMNEPKETCSRTVQTEPFDTVESTTQTESCVPVSVCIGTMTEPCPPAMPIRPTVIADQEFKDDRENILMNVKSVIESCVKPCVNAPVETCIPDSPEESEDSSEDEDPLWYMDKDVYVPTKVATPVVLPEEPPSVPVSQKPLEEKQPLCLKCFNDPPTSLGKQNVIFNSKGLFIDWLIDNPDPNLVLQGKCTHECQHLLRVLKYHKERFGLIPESDYGYYRFRRNLSRLFLSGVRLAYNPLV